MLSTLVVGLGQGGLVVEGEEDTGEGLREETDEGDPAEAVGPVEVGGDALVQLILQRLA